MALTVMAPPVVAGALVLALGALARRPRLRASAHTGAGGRAVGLAGRSWWRGRRRAPEVDHLAELRAVAAAGGSLSQALGVVAAGQGAWADAAGAVVVAARRGRPLQDGLDAWAAVAGDGEVALLVAALAVAGGTGGSHLLALDGVAQAVAERRSLQREIRALSSQARASAVVLVLTPVVFAVLVALLDQRVLAFWTGSLAGPATGAVGAVLDLVGAAWMAALVRRVR